MKHLVITIFILIFFYNNVFSQKCHNCDTIDEDKYFSKFRGVLISLDCKDSIVFRGEGSFSIKVSFIKQKIYGRAVLYKNDYLFMINGLIVPFDTYFQIIQTTKLSEQETYLELINSDTCQAKLFIDTELTLPIYINGKEQVYYKILNHYEHIQLKDEDIISIKRKKRLFKKNYIEIITKDT
ncbi:MAG: hypothetical protein LBV69_05865 [Bacteroidales bacterium]|jgi:hypothetical protein|nr:hypothetical protein [Bacteroidales bacterium]